MAVRWGIAPGIRGRILRAFEAAELEPSPEQRRAWTTFVVISGGPTGVELAGALAEIAGRTLAADVRRFDPRTTRVFLVKAGPRILSSFSENLSERAREQLLELGVQVRLGTPVSTVQSGRLAAANVLRRIAGEPTEKIWYRDRGSMATIGRHRAVAQIGTFECSGVLAWWLWLVVHVLAPVDFRRRLAVLVEWAWAYVTLAAPLARHPGGPRGAAGRPHVILPPRPHLGGFRRPDAFNSTRALHSSR